MSLLDQLAQQARGDVEEALRTNTMTVRLPALSSDKDGGAHQPPTRVAGLVKDLNLQEHTEDPKSRLVTILVAQSVPLLIGTKNAAEKQEDEKALAKLLSFVNSTALPGSLFAIDDFTDSKIVDKDRSREKRLYFLLAAAAIDLLERIRSCVSDPSPPLWTSSLLENTLPLPLSFMNSKPVEDSWTNEFLRQKAIDLQARLMGGLETTASRSATSEGSSERNEGTNGVKSVSTSSVLDQALTSILRDRIKPIFTNGRSRNPAITDQARRAIENSHVNIPRPIEEDDNAGPLWRTRDVYAPVMLVSIVGQLNTLGPKFLESNWPLLIPPILTLLDDTTSSSKIIGCRILQSLLTQVAPQLLDRTGLRDVFENTLTPCLLHLPTLTKEESSIQLLNAAYPALIALANTWSPKSASSLAISTETVASDERLKALDRVMRRGILTGFAHAGEYVKIAEVLCAQLRVLVEEMGIAVVKHMKHIVPILSSTLTARLALSYPPLLRTALQTTQTLILVAWPRIPYHQGELVNGLTTLWCRLEDEKILSEELVEVRDSTRLTTHMLLDTLKETADVGEIRRLVEVNPAVQSLLATF